MCGYWVPIGPGEEDSRLNPTGIASINRLSTSPQHVEMKHLGSSEAPPLSTDHESFRVMNPSKPTASPS